MRQNFLKTPPVQINFKHISIKKKTQKPNCIFLKLQKYKSRGWKHDVFILVIPYPEKNHEKNYWCVLLQPPFKRFSKGGMFYLFTFEGYGVS